LILHRIVTIVVTFLVSTMESRTMDFSSLLDEWTLDSECWQFPQNPCPPQVPFQLDVDQSVYSAPTGMQGIPVVPEYDFWDLDMVAVSCPNMSSDAQPLPTAAGDLMDLEEVSNLSSSSPFSMPPPSDVGSVEINLSLLSVGNQWAELEESSSCSSGQSGAKERYPVPVAISPPAEPLVYTVTIPHQDVAVNMEPVGLDFHIERGRVNKNGGMVKGQDWTVSVILF
jgi:hypothetical protein